MVDSFDPQPWLKSHCCCSNPVFNSSFDRYAGDKPPLTDKDQVVVVTDGTLLLSCCALPFLLWIKWCVYGSNPGTRPSQTEAGPCWKGLRVGELIQANATKQPVISDLGAYPFSQDMLVVNHALNLEGLPDTPCMICPFYPRHTWAWVANQYQSPTQGFKMLWHTVLEG